MVDTQDHLGPCGDGAGGKASEPRKEIDHFHLFVLLLRSPTQVAPKCVSHQVPTTTHLSRGTLTCAHSGSARLTAPVRARAERAWVHGERVVAVPQHATRRCGGRAGMVCGGGWARGAGQTVPASHVDDEACVSFCMLREGRENQRTSGESARSLPPSPRLDSFICREPFSVYSRGMATMATMATPKLKVEKKMKGKEVG